MFSLEYQQQGGCRPALTLVVVVVVVGADPHPPVPGKHVVVGADRRPPAPRTQLVVGADPHPPIPRKQLLQTGPSGAAILGIPARDPCEGEV